MENNNEMDKNELNFNKINTNNLNIKKDLINNNERNDYDIIEEKIIYARSGSCMICVIFISFLLILGFIIGIWIFFAKVSKQQILLCIIFVILTFILLSFLFYFVIHLVDFL